MRHRPVSHTEVGVTTTKSSTLLHDWLGIPSNCSLNWTFPIGGEKKGFLVVRFTSWIKPFKLQKGLMQLKLKAGFPKVVWINSFPSRAEKKKSIRLHLKTTFRGGRSRQSWSRAMESVLASSGASVAASVAVFSYWNRSRHPREGTEAGVSRSGCFSTELRLKSNNSLSSSSWGELDLTGCDSDCCLLCCLFRLLADMECGCGENDVIIDVNQCKSWPFLLLRPLICTFFID